MKLFKKLSLVILGLLFTGSLVAGSGQDLEWTKDKQTDVVPKISKDTGKPTILGNGGVAFALGNGAVSFFPEASGEELKTMGEGGVSFTVYDRFRVISTLVETLDLDESQYAGSQKVPSAELLELAQAVVAGEISGIEAQIVLAELSSDYAGYIQYHFQKK